MGFCYATYNNNKLICVAKPPYVQSPEGHILLRSQKIFFFRLSCNNCLMLSNFVTSLAITVSVLFV